MRAYIVKSENWCKETQKHIVTKQIAYSFGEAQRIARSLKGYVTINEL